MKFHWTEVDPREVNKPIDISTNLCELILPEVDPREVNKPGHGLWQGVQAVLP